MSVMSFERPTAGHVVWRAIAEVVGRFVRELRREQKARRDRRHLMQLPDYLLKDIGVSRIEIDAITGWDDRPRYITLPDISWRRQG